MNNFEIDSTLGFESGGFDFLIRGIRGQNLLKTSELVLDNTANLSREETRSSSFRRFNMSQGKDSKNFIRKFKR